MVKFIFVLMAIFSLSGCGAFGKKYNSLNVKNTEIVKIKIPEDLLTPCAPSTPISKEEYMLKMPYERELYLAGYSSELLTVIKDCDIRLNKIKELQTKF